MQGALQGSGNAPSGRVAGRISIGVGPRSACGIIIIDIESWERWWGGGGGGLGTDVKRVGDLGLLYHMGGPVPLMRLAATTPLRVCTRTGDHCSMEVG